MEIVRFLNLPERTVFYINKMFSNETGKSPVDRKSNGSKHEKVLRFLILSIMTAILMPVTFSIVKPDCISFIHSQLISGRCSRAPPISGALRSVPPDTYSRQNRQRERHSSAARTVTDNSDTSECSDLSSDPDSIIRSIFKKDEPDRYFNMETRSGFLYMFDKDGNKIYRNFKKNNKEELSIL